MPSRCRGGAGNEGGFSFSIVFPFARRDLSWISSGRSPVSPDSVARLTTVAKGGHRMKLTAAPSRRDRLLGLALFVPVT